MIRETGANNADDEVTHSFADGDVLKIAEEAVIVIGGLTFQCSDVCAANQYCRSDLVLGSKCVSTCGSGCLRGPVPASECPTDPFLARCDSVSVGSYCEGNGECGTSTSANNC